MLHRITTDPAHGLPSAALPLYSTEAIRTMERHLAKSLPPHTLMARAGASVAALAKAVAPHARSIWIACGPGNNGGDGLVAAALLQPWCQTTGAELLVSWCGQEEQLPPDARFALDMARRAGVQFSSPPAHCDVAIDALLGIGARACDNAQPSDQQRLLAHWSAHLRQCAPTLLCVDIPSGMDAETGTNTIAITTSNTSARSTFCLTFIGLKPGLFTAAGREQSGQVWLDDLGWQALPRRPAVEQPAPMAWLGCPTPPPTTLPRHHRHNTHKGDFGDVWVLGGQGLHPSGAGMAGAALLVATAALHAGAGRVWVAMLDSACPSWDPTQPELMLRAAHHLLGPEPLPSGTWVGGCGGGEAIVPHLPKLLTQARALVLDADALNAVARRPDLQALLTSRRTNGLPTVLTPHPLEAARLLGTDTAHIQNHRLAAARQLATTYQCVCVLKGSGTVLATPSGMVCINASGNARLSTAGTGDVLAGMLGTALAGAARGPAPQDVALRPASFDTWLDDTVLPVVARAVYGHGLAADRWPPGETLTAGALARRISPTPSAPPAAAAAAPRATDPPHPPGE